ncbi:MAG: COG4315 family predicted lipoprotein [Solirubrobacterales bacterium]
MNKKSHVLAPLAALAALAVVIAGCGGGSSTSSETSSSGSKKTASSASSAGTKGTGYGGGSENKSASSESSGGSAAVVSLGHTKVGMVLVDSNGMTLYDFHKDKGTTSSCYGACEQAWPPMTTEGKPTVGNGASASKLGTTERKDGTMQVTYAGHPLYTFVEDKKPGEANGNDTSAFGSQWYALKGNGEEAGG